MCMSANVIIIPVLYFDCIFFYWEYHIHNVVAVVKMGAYTHAHRVLICLWVSIIPVLQYLQ